jgi:hypothetical protein
VAAGSEGGTVIDQALTAFLERGGAMIIGTVTPDGMPHAQRCWGCAVLGPTTIRIALDASDGELASHLVVGGRIAITSADVRTLRSVQLKGRISAVEDPGPDDLARCDAHNDELFTDIYEADHFPRELTERMVPPGYIVAVVEVEDLFDQTPGPGAGARGTGAVR